MRRSIWALPLLAILVLVGYVAAGPYLAIRAIGQAIERQDTDALEQHVNFPALRVNLKTQLDDSLIRQAGSALQTHPLEEIALHVASAVAGAGVDAMVTPLGIGALLQGRTLWKRASADTVGDDSYAAPTPDRPFAHYEGRFDSFSCFSATVHTASGTPVIFVLTRNGLRWKLSNIALSRLLDGT